KRSAYFGGKHVFFISLPTQTCIVSPSQSKAPSPARRILYPNLTTAPRATSSLVSITNSSSYRAGTRYRACTSTTEIPQPSSSSVLFCSCLYRLSFSIRANRRSSAVSLPNRLPLLQKRRHSLAKIVRPPRLCIRRQRLSNRRIQPHFVLRSQQPLRRRQSLRT